jgi:pilus assembly protein CpaB
MSQRVLTILLTALLIAAGASYMVFRLVRTRISSAAGPTTSEVIVAAHKIELGSLVKDIDLRTGPWVGPVPQGILLKKEDAVGRGVISTIYEGEPVLDSRLAGVGGGAGLAATIPPGMRAVAVRVNDVVGVAGFVVPGMKVDILISGIPPGASAAGPRVKTLLQNIEVLSAATNIQKDPEGKPLPVPVVNLLVTPEQAEILSLASNETRIQLILRNPLDNEPSKTSGVALGGLFSGEKAAPVAHAARPAPKPVAPPAAVPAPPKPFSVEVLNGPRRTEVKFARRQEDPQ